MNYTKPAGRKPVRIITILLAVIGLLALPMATAASAAEIPGAVTSVKITGDPTKQLKVGERFSMEAEWQVPDTAKAGDTFTLSFPSTITGYRSSFDLTAPDGSSIGTCQVQDTTFVCTLSDYVDTHDNVSGTLDFTATASKQTDSKTLDFETGNNVTISTELPGGGGISPGSGGWKQPNQPIKLGDVTFKRHRDPVDDPGSGRGAR